MMPPPTLIVNLGPEPAAVIDPHAGCFVLGLRGTHQGQGYERALPRPPSRPPLLLPGLAAMLDLDVLWLRCDCAYSPYRGAWCVRPAAACLAAAMRRAAARRRRRAAASTAAGCLAAALLAAAAALLLLSLPCGQRQRWR
jgi:hypothetical protein